MMADSTNKRQGKAPVATPKSPPPTSGAPGTPVSLDAALHLALGAKVRLHTAIAGAETLQGVILNISPFLNIITIVTAPAPSTHHVLALSALKDFELLPPNAFSMPAMAIPERPPPLDMDAAMARANAALAKAKEKAAKRNLNVGKEVQEIFDAIGKQLPVRWDGKDIVVMDQVIIKGPGYKGDDCVAAKNAGQNALARVKKVLENERKRLPPRDQGKGPKPAVPVIPAIPAFTGGPRKGG